MKYTFITIGLSMVLFFGISTDMYAATAVTLTPSRTTGVAPLSVFFDAASTTNVAVTSQPFHELDYAWDFGDVTAGVWTYGTASTSKNVAYGPVTAHVFEPTSFPDDCSGTSCKIFTVTLAVFDGTETVETTTTIEVMDPDDVFSGTNTICINASGTDHTGCPANAATTTQSNFTTVIDTYAATGKRLLLKRGDVFTTATTAYLNQDGPWIVGAYGSGAKPIVRSTLATDASLGTYGGILVIGSGSGGVFMDDGRIMDIAINANDGAGNIVGKGTTAIRGGAGTFTKITYLRVDISDLNNAFSFSTSNLSTTLDTMWDENTIQDSTVYNLINQGGNGMYVMGKRMAILGNFIDNNGGGEHNFRSMYWNKLVLSNNRFANPNTTKANISLRSMYDAAATSFLPANSWSEYAVVSNNQMAGTGATISVATFNDQGFDRRSRNVIFERNWWHDQSGSNYALSISSSDLTTARNNIMNVDGAVCVTASTDNNPSYIFGTHWVYNNTCYTTSLGDAWGERAAMRVYADVGAMDFSNNLVYMPNVTNTVYMPMLDVSAGPITLNNNSTSLQARTTNPFGTPTPPPSTTSSPQPVATPSLAEQVSPYTVTSTVTSVEAPWT